ncbi:hypothetical protein FRC96_15115 [Lujinxingia vulgaris]|uniref:Uncharacterized protein n=1 Tax=Lujinxingia vulgaris TaxID=2600176 RepID=A0A5C6X987_9DELT|nr:hypothetical protein [Lujinxingia vulgaris]TXD33799.1 hypothetical protein FRC96_15115 [Lujinxingia vulgaris]
MPITRDTFDFTIAKQRAGDPSLRELENRIREHFTVGEDGRELSKSSGSIANYLSKLQNGDATWWENFPAACRALADALNVKAEVLPFYQSTAPADRRIPFPEFPELPPFDPLDDEFMPARYTSRCETCGESKPVVLGPFGWTDSQEFQLHTANELIWIQAPTSTDASLLAAHLTVNNPRNIQRPKYFERADIGADTTDTCIVLPQRPGDPGHGTRFAEELARDASANVIVRRALLLPPLTVVATFAPPWKTDTTPNAAIHGWCIAPWDPDHIWRHGYLEWVGSRLDSDGRGGRFNPTETFKWLERHDPDLKRFKTPADLRHICRVAFREGHKALDGFLKTTEVRLWLERTCETLDDTHPRKRSMESKGANAFLSAVERWLLSPHLAWNSSLTAEQWRGLLLSTTQSAIHEDLARLLDQIVESEDREEREKVRDSFDEQRTLDDLLQAYVDLELLVWTHHDQLDAQPQWVLEAFARKLVREEIASGDTSRWGRLAADASRQYFIIEALEELDDAAFKSTLAATLRAFEARNFAHVAALEALFFCAPSRATSPTFASDDILKRLWNTYRDLRNATLGEESNPRMGFLKPLFYRHPKGQDIDFTTLIRLWEWSANVPRPANWQIHQDSWLTPGWADEFPDELPSWFQTFPYDPLVSDDAFSLFNKLLEKIPSEQVAIPTLLLPSLLLTQPDHPKLQPTAPRVVFSDNVASLLKNSELCLRLAHKLTQHTDDEARLNFATLIWRSIIQNYQGTSMPFKTIFSTLETYEELGQIVLDYVPTRTVIEQLPLSDINHNQIQNVLEGFDRHSNEYMGRQLSYDSFNKRLTEPLLKWIFNHYQRLYKDSYLHSFEQLPGSFQSTLPKLPELFLGYAQIGFGFSGDTRDQLWRTSSREVKELIRVLVKESPKHAEYWLWRAPPAEMNWIFELLSQQPELRRRPSFRSLLFDLLPKSGKWGGKLWGWLMEDPRGDGVDS